MCWLIYAEVWVDTKRMTNMIHTRINEKEQWSWPYKLNFSIISHINNIINLFQIRRGDQGLVEGGGE